MKSVLSTSRSHCDVLFSNPLTGSPHIPQDVLVHIFSFLDMRSLVAAGLVCWYLFLILSANSFKKEQFLVYHTFVFLRRSWNSAANDGDLWKTNYSLFFGLPHLSCNSIVVSGVQNSHDLVQTSMHSVPIDPNYRWKEYFHSKYAGSSGGLSFCIYTNHTSQFPWLSN